MPNDAPRPLRYRADEVGCAVTENRDVGTTRPKPLELKDTSHSLPLTKYPLALVFLANKHLSENLTVGPKAS